MSTYYDVWCRDCQTSMGCRVRNLGADLYDVLAVAPHVVALDDALRVLDRTAVDAEVTVWRERVSPEWLRQHAGHSLTVRDEYGEELPPRSAPRWPPPPKS